MKRILSVMLVLAVMLTVFAGSSKHSNEFLCSSGKRQHF